MKFNENGKIRCAIFDLDGTLIKSIDAWRDVDTVFMEKRNLPIPDGYYEKVSAMDFSQAADYVINECGVRDSKEAVITEWLETIKQEYAENIEMVDGAKEFLHLVKREGVKICLATASKPELFKPCLTRHGVLSLFDVFVTTDEVERKKGYPDVYLLAAERAGVSPDECAVFEDIYSGCKGAKAAQMYTVGVYERHSAEDWDKMRQICDVMIGDYYELMGN